MPFSMNEDILPSGLQSIQDTGLENPNNVKAINKSIMSERWQFNQTNYEIFL